MFDHREMTKRKYHSVEFKFVAPPSDRFGGPLFLYCMALLPFLRRVGRHQFIELCILREGIGEWNNIARAPNQPAACRDIGDVAKLVIGDVQQLGQLLAVGGALVQHDQKFRVGQHQAGGVRAQQLVHILRQPGHKTVVFADAFPQLVEKVCTVLLAEQKYR